MKEQLLGGKRIHIAGSISPETSGDVAAVGHEIVRSLVEGILRMGGGIVVGAGKEPRLESGQPQLFDWTTMEVIAESIKEGGCPESAGEACPIIVVVSEKGEREIPESRSSS